MGVQSLTGKPAMVLATWAGAWFLPDRAFLFGVNAGKARLCKGSGANLFEIIY